MFQFPRTIPRRRRLVFGCLGVVCALAVWWLLTHPFFTEQVVMREAVATGQFEEVENPATGQMMQVEILDHTERLVERPTAIVNPPALESPQKTLATAWKLVTREHTIEHPNLLHHMGWSTLRVLLGFLISGIIAVPLGIAMGLFPHLRAMVMPLISFLRPLPSISWVPLAIIWLGVDETQKLAIIFMGSFSAALIYTIEATIKVPPDIIKAAQNLGVSDRQLLWKVLLPAALPNIVSGLKVVLAIAWTCVISAEIVGSPTGLGALIWQSKEIQNTAAVLVGMAGISAIVLVLDLVTNRVERLLLPWVYKERER